MANPSLFYCLRFVFRTFLLNFQGCHCSIIKVHLFVCAARCSHRLCYFSTSLCACQVLFKTFFRSSFELLKSYRTVLLCLFCSNSDILSKSFGFVKYFFHLFDSVPGSSGRFPDCLYLRPRCFCVSAATFDILPLLFLFVNNFFDLFFSSCFSKN